MDERKKPNSGALFSSKVKKTPKAPDYFGNFLLDLRTMKIEDNMVQFKLSGWKSISRAGTTYLELKVDTYEGGEKKAKQEDNDDPFQ